MILCCIVASALQRNSLTRSLIIQLGESHILFNSAIAVALLLLGLWDWWMEQYRKWRTDKSYTTICTPVEVLLFMDFSHTDFWRGRVLVSHPEQRVQARRLVDDLTHAVQVDLGIPAKLLRPLHR